MKIPSRSFAKLYRHLLSLLFFLLDEYEDEGEGEERKTHWLPDYLFSRSSLDYFNELTKSEK